MLYRRALSAPTVPRERGRAGAWLPDPRGGAPSSSRETPLAFLRIAALSAFAVAQPLFDLIGRTPEFLATRGAGPVEVVVLALALVLVPPVLLVAVELAAGLLGRRVRRAAHLAIVAGLATLLFSQALKAALPDGGAALLALSLALGAGAAALYARVRGVRGFLTVLAPAPVVFLLIFLVLSPVARLTTGGQTEARASAVAAQAPVVVVVFDELPLTSLLDARGRIDGERLPGFAALARESTWFRHATTLSDQTTKAVPAILSGRRPRAGGSRSSVSGSLPIAADYPNNLFTMLGRRYTHNVSEEVTTLCPQDLCADERGDAGLADRFGSLASDLALVYLHVALPQPVAETLPSVSETWGDFSGDEVEKDPSRARRDARAQVEEAIGGARVERFERFLARVGPGEGPSLHFKHSMFPHAPWEYLPSGRRYRTGAREPVSGLVPSSGTTTLGSEFLVEQAYQRHLLQVGFADRSLGRLLARMRERGLYDQAAIVVVADHGVSFRPGLDRRGPVEANVEDIASVPLLIKAPGQRRGEVNDAYVQTHEVLPTLADVLGVRMPWRVEGRSGFSREAARRSSIPVHTRRGGTIVLGEGELERRLAAAAARRAAVFGRGTAGLYGIGPHSELVGRPVGALDPAPPNGVRAAFKRPGRLAAYDPRSGFSPSHVVGRLRGGGEGTRDLAVAVNGRVAAVARSHRSRDGDEEYFSALVPESSLRPGRNAVELFEVATGSGPGPRLRSLGRT